jgi:diguanylate cyclase (GGDEF)-like protein
LDQQRLSAVLAEFARTLVGDFSIQEILDRLARRVVEVIPSDGAGVVLLDEEARLHFVAATDEQILVIQQLQLELGEGPCIVTYETGEPVIVPDLRLEPRFKRFAARAVQEGLGAVCSFPLRLDSRRLGALDLYSREPRELSADDIVGGQILADVAAAYIFNAQARVDAAASAEALRHRALHDPLTKLPNRALMEDRLELALAKSRRSHALTGLLFVDLDRFKAVNDTFGHLVGDRLLIAVAHRLASALRPGDTLARIAGDEFLVVCEDLSDLGHGEQIAARMHAVLEAPFAIDPNSITVSASIGIAVSSDPRERSADLLLHADAALYEAKRRGRGQSHTASERARTETDRRLNVERHLRHAIDNDELELVYQPIFELSTASAARVEALLRWNHPQLGEIGAPAIVASAERTGMIRDLGGWVLRSACRQLRDWQDAGVPVRCVCVNVAAAEFSDPAYCEAVHSTCAGAGIDPSALCLEITESVLIDDVPGALVGFDGLKRVGVQLALDDFGTGYSSLGYLRRFPVDIVKIDQTFVAGILTEPMDKAIVDAVISLAHAIDMTVVAEGVEAPHQQAAVAELGCDMAQGFHLARPMPPGAIADRLQTAAG